MPLIRSSIAAAGLGVLALVASPAIAAEQTYTYSIVHPTFGEIGSFTSWVDRTGDETRIRTQLEVAVRMIGLVVYREITQGTEVLRGRRLISLDNVGEDDGKQINVHGKVDGGQFVVKSPAGQVVAPLDVQPSDPWLVHGETQGKVVSTRTGQVLNANVTGGESVTIQLQGSWVHTRHYVVLSDNRQEVWMADDSVPVMFRSVEDGTPIDFVLKTPLAQALPGYVAAAPGSTAMNARRDHGGN